MCGYQSYLQTRGRATYVRDQYTFRHLSKLILSGLISLGCLLFLVIYVLTEPEEISIKTSITAGASFLVWAFNSILLRKEYKSLGYTTNDLRIAWITFLVCQSLLFIFALSGANSDSLSQVVAIYVLNEIFMIAITIIGFSYANDFPKPKNKEHYASLMKESVLDVGDDYFQNVATPLDQSMNSEVDQENPGNEPNFRPFAEDLGEKKRKPKKANNILDGDGEHKFYQGPAQVKLREDIHLIESIDVTGFEDIIRLNKETTVYIIEFVIKGKRLGTKRSYSEFEALRKNIKKLRGDMQLPEIPPKKGLSKTKDPEGLNARKEAFDRLLKAIVQGKVGLNHLAEFLQTPNVLSNYKKGHKNSEIKNEETTPQALTGERRNEANKEVKAKVMDPSAVRANIIPDYTHGDEGRSQSFNSNNTAGKYYEVEIPDVFTGHDSSTYYKINILERSSGWRANLSKRYNDFKEFHTAFKKTLGKYEKQSLQELPYKGNVQGFATRDDRRVIDFRKVALKTYLQNILNNERFQENSVVKEFIQPNNI